MAAKIAADSAALSKATEFSYYPPFFHPAAPANATAGLVNKYSFPSCLELEYDEVA